MWCWHHIRENLNGLCPACRTPYNADPHTFNAVDRQEIVKKNREQKKKEKLDKKVTDKPGASVIDRRHLHNYRYIIIIIIILIIIILIILIIIIIIISLLLLVLFKEILFM